MMRITAWSSRAPLIRTPGAWSLHARPMHLAAVRALHRPPRGRGLRLVGHFGQLP
jgi:hypothetical protein